MRLCGSLPEITFDRFVLAVIQVESSGKDNAVGDTNRLDWAYGPLQIRKQCVDDVNEFCRTSYTSRDMLGNRKLSVWLFRNYLRRYATRKALGHEPTFEDMARIWNGGPQGWKNSTTKAYWAKVQKALKSIR